MKLLTSLSEGFQKTSARERLLITAAVAATIVLGGNLLLLKPQRLNLNQLRAEEQSVRNDFMRLGSILSQIKDENARGIDPFANEKAHLAELKDSITQVEFFFQGEDSTTSQIGNLVRSLIRDNPTLSLLSLKTLPSTVFYTPPAKTKSTAAVDAAKDMLSKIKKDELKQADNHVVLVNKPLYKHGVQVVVKGTFPTLLAYMQQMEHYPKRIFWSETTIDANDHRAAKLKLLIYTLSDQAMPPLN